MLEFQLAPKQKEPQLLQAENTDVYSSFPSHEDKDQLGKHPIPVHARQGGEFAM